MTDPKQMQEELRNTRYLEKSRSALHQTIGVGKT